MAFDIFSNWLGKIDMSVPLLVRHNKLGLKHYQVEKKETFLSLDYFSEPVGKTHKHCLTLCKGTPCVNIPSSPPAWRCPTLDWGSRKLPPWSGRTASADPHPRRAGSPPAGCRESHLAWERTLSLYWHLLPGALSCHWPQKSQLSLNNHQAVY